MMRRYASTTDIATQRNAALAALCTRGVATELSLAPTETPRNSSFTATGDDSQLHAHVF